MPRLSVFAIVRRLREQRWGMVSTDAQYEYLYQFLEEWVQNQETADVLSKLMARSGLAAAASSSLISRAITLPV